MKLPANPRHRLSSHADGWVRFPPTGWLGGTQLEQIFLPRKDTDTEKMWGATCPPHIRAKNRCQTCTPGSLT